MSAAVVLAIAVLVGLVATGLLRRVRVRASVQASIEGDGAWAAAGGAQCGPIALSVAASNVGRAWAVDLFGRRVARGTSGGAGAAHDFLRRRPTVASTLGALADLLARVQVEPLELHVRCGARDPALTGPVAGTLAALSGALSPWARITHEIDWLSDDDRVELHGRTEIAVSPARAVMALRRLRLAPRRLRATPPPTLAAATKPV